MKTVRITSVALSVIMVALLVVLINVLATASFASYGDVVAVGFATAVMFMATVAVVAVAIDAFVSKK